METRLISDGYLHHLQTLVLGDQRSCVLKGVMRTYDKPQFVESLVFEHVVCNCQMPDMRGIERARKYSGLFHLPGVHLRKFLTRASVS